MACLTLVGALLLAIGCSTPPSDSGIEGEVRIGPVSPVETAGTPASAPYAAEMLIHHEDGRGKVVRVRSGEDGRFRVNLAPGIYVVEPVVAEVLPVAAPVTVEVEPHRFAKVTINYDSGIR